MAENIGCVICEIEQLKGNGFVLIDFHVHAFNPKVADRAVQKLQDLCGVVPYTRGFVDQTIRRFDEWNVDRGVLLPIATKPSQQTVINDWVKEQDGDRLISFGSVHPDAEDAVDELNRIKKMGLHGIKLHPDYQNFMVNEKRLDPIYDELERLGLPVTFHAGYDCVSPDLIHCPPELSRETAVRHPGMKMIFAHMGGNDCWRQVLDCLAGVDGEVYLDTSFSMNCENSLMEKIISRHGSERILFASDCPWESPALLAEKIDSLKISDDAKENIYHKNAQRLLGIG